MKFALIFFIFYSGWVGAAGVREVSANSCKVIVVNLALGMTTQIVLEQEPKTTLFADKKHFKIITNPSSPRSLAVIPVIENADLEPFKSKQGDLPAPEHLVEILNKNFKTNLFVFFDHDNQLQFEFHFVERTKNDYVLKVKETFSEECQL